MFMPALALPLPELLHRTFGHREFRAHQQPVCEAAASGRDVLLVMPTGAGKSLCYQLPALARGGTALVISPLIALMDDQASKLDALNLRVARIHSGRSREDSRRACRDYLDGNLDFLFIAPERLRVPGFPEMLARRKPALIAVDEAHCISQWGHDFRPDYRTLAQHLQALRPAPVIALTATATPTVQRDILRALNLVDPAVFITGFRRENLQIEVTELSKPQRAAFITKLLADKAARPAIVYASSRSSAEELAGTLSRSFPAAAYHAGLDAGTRDRVQTAFLSGKLDVVVATIAFGMGVDKADVRTVVHASLPGSVEAFYQEIGRAGRDGQPSRTVLLHSFADRKMHDFFIERDYPAVKDVERVAGALRSELVSVEALQQQLDLSREVVERCVDKLLSQGAAVAEMDGTIRGTGTTGWQGGYDAQLRHRREQVDRMVAFAEGTGCRMAALVRHFGDTGDGGRLCGRCDSCAPDRSQSAPAHPPGAAEAKDLNIILAALKDGPRASGKLFSDLNLMPERKQFDSLVDGLARAGLIHIATETFRTDDGRDVSYRKLALTPEGRDPDAAAIGTVWLRGSRDADDAPSRRRTRTPGAGSRSNPASAPEPPLTAEAAELLERLKGWRLDRAKETGAPAFTVFHDSVLRAIAAARPTTLSAVENLRGIGREKLDRFGADLVALCRGTALPPPPPGRGGEPPAVSSERKQLRAATPSAAGAGKPVIARMGAMPEVKPSPQTPTARLTEAQKELDTRFREWRREQAARSGLPSFFVLSDTALRKVVTANPQSLEELRSAADLGADKLARFGAEMLALCRTESTVCL